jgi:hypothetical protein
MKERQDPIDNFIDTTIEDSLPTAEIGDCLEVLRLIKQAESFLLTMNEARSKAQYASVIKAQENIVKISKDIDKIRAVVAAKAEPVDGVGSKKATLKAIRASRAAAFSDGSYGPANSLLAQEQELVYSIIADDNKVDDNLSEEEMFEIITSSLSQFSDVQKAKLLELLR